MPQRAPVLSPDHEAWEEWEERAAIREYDAAESRAEAEARAAEKLGLIPPGGTLPQE